MAELLHEAWAEIAGNPVLYIIELIQFAILVAIIVYAGKKVIGGYLTRRHDRISADVAEAAKGREALAYARSEAKAIVDEARKEAAATVRRAQAGARKALNEAKAQAEREAAVVLKQAGETVTAERRSVAEESARRFVELIPILARRYIEEELSEADRRAMIEDTIISGLKELRTAGGP